jgi:hypothetical protein
MGFRHSWHVLALSAVVACGGGSGVSDSAYVATVASLYRVNTDTSLDSARRVAARRRVLQQQGLTAAALERAAADIADDPDRAAAIATAIERRWRGPPDSAQRARSRRPRPPDSASRAPTPPATRPESSAPRP